MFSARSQIVPPLELTFQQVCLRSKVALNVRSLICVLQSRLVLEVRLPLELTLLQVCLRSRVAFRNVAGVKGFVV